ncbi:MAG: DUF1893 domain-containing protein [Calditrichaeota bacterium]|nr:DUF1893 domain-containing protein [Calditrichota bacterium]
MNTDLEMAGEILRKGGLSFVVVKDGQVLAKETGPSVQPLAKFLKEHSEEVKGASLADKVVGRAVAILSAFHGIKAVFALLMSEGAVKFLQSHEIHYEYQTRVPVILNMRGDGPCPIEKSLSLAETPEEGMQILRERGFVK